jgi:hypothetical protein
MKKVTPIKEIKSYSGVEVLMKMKEKYKLAFKVYKENGGMCQKCVKEKAEYPGGLNPFNCKKCNDGSQEIIDKLHNGTLFKF